MKHLFAAAAVAAALSSFAAQKTSVSVAEPYLFTDDAATLRRELSRAAFARLAGPSKRLKTIVVGETGRIDSPCGRSVSFRLTEREDAYDVEIFGDGPYDGDVFTVFFDPRPAGELNTVGKYYWKDVKGREGQTSMKTTVPFSTWGGARPGEYAALARAINDLCWDESLGFYFDRGPDGLVRRWNVGSFWTLLARVATPERARRMAAALEDPDIFGRPVPVPSLAANDPDYAPETAYWRGAVWPPTTYMTILGLRAYGMDSLAERIARRWYNANAALFEKTGTIFENISPEQFDHPKSAAGRDFCGWSALAPVSVPALFGWR